LFLTRFFSSPSPDSQNRTWHRLCRYPRLYIVSILYGLSGGMHVGYQISVTNSLSHVLKPYFNESVAQSYGIRLSELGLTVCLHLAILNSKTRNQAKLNMSEFYNKTNN
jgi:hypothetical protein